jgi:hypothetical protein
MKKKTETDQELLKKPKPFMYSVDCFFAIGRSILYNFPVFIYVNGKNIGETFRSRKIRHKSWLQ